MSAYNKGKVIRGGFGSTFRRIVCHANNSDRVRDRARSEGLHGRAGDLRATQRLSLHGCVLAVCSGGFGEDQQEPGLLGQPADFDEAFDRLELRIIGQDGCV